VGGVLRERAEMKNPHPDPLPEYGARRKKGPARENRIVPVIAGVGLISPLGDCLDSTWQSLMAGRYITDHSPAQFADRPGSARIMQLAIAAAREAMRSAGPAASGRTAGDAAVIIGTSKGPAQRWITPKPVEISFANISAGRCGCVDGAGLGEVAAAVADALDLAGPRLTYSAACASGLHALIRGAMMIVDGDVDAALVIGAESSLQEIFLASFQRLGLLADLKIGCRPMDEFRDGLLVSEAAAAVWMVRSDSPDIGHVRLPIVVESMFMGSDGYHLTGVDPDGKALRTLIEQTLGESGVDLVHAHATGTRANDGVELDALDEALDRRGCNAIAYSHKGALGHSLGASGMVSTVLAVKSHQTGTVAGNIRTSHPLATRHLQISQRPIHATIARTLILAAGFGGPVATVCLKTR